MIHRRYASPVGEYVIIVDDGAITGIHQAEFPHPDAGEEDPSAAQDAVDQLEEYFAGTRREFDLPLRAEGTEFQRRVWAEIAKIPFGGTTTYGEIARTLGSSPRAVGTATGRNPHSIVVPCHRVVAADRALTGYAGGLDRKVTLLRIEGFDVARDADASSRLP